jgi:hypothetical protein
MACEVVPYGGYLTHRRGVSCSSLVVPRERDAVRCVGPHAGTFAALAKGDVVGCAGPRRSGIELAGGNFSERCQRKMSLTRNVCAYVASG